MTSKNRRRLAAWSALAALVSGVLLVTPSGATAQAVAPTKITVNVGQTPNDVTISPNQQWAYVTNWSGNTVSVIQRSTHIVVSTIPVGVEPSEVDFAPSGSVAYIVNYGDQSISIVDVATRKVTKTVQLPDPGPEFAAVSPDGTIVNIVTAYGTVDALSTKTDAVAQLFNPPGTLGGFGAAVFSQDANIAYLTFFGNGGGAGALYAVNVAAGTAHLVASVESNASALAITPDGSTAFVADGLSPPNLSRVNLSTGVVTDTTLTVQAKGLSVSPDGSTLVMTGLDNAARLMSVSSGAISSPITIDQAPVQTLFSSDSKLAYVLSKGAYGQAGSESTIDLATQKVIATVGVGNAPLAMAQSADGAELYVVNSNDDQVSVLNAKALGWHPNVNRIGGADRYATAVAISRAEYPQDGEQVQTLFVASGADFPDALSAASVAKYAGGPILLTPPTSLPTEVRNEIIRLQPQTIDVIGGPSVVSDHVFSLLTPLAANPVVRLSGSDRYATNEAVLKTHFGTFGSGPNVAYIATGENYPDALSASAAAVYGGNPVVLVPGSQPQLTPAEMTFVSSLGAHSFAIVGGTSVVSTGIESELGTLGKVVRLAGTNRYETSRVVNASVFNAASVTEPPHAYFATGTGFADALAGTVLAEDHLSPLYVVNPTCVPAQTEADLAQGAVPELTLFGSAGALSANVANLIICP